MTILQVATPICYDQFDNAAEIVNLGIGVSIPFIDITEEKLSDLLDQVLQNDNYAKTTQKLIHYNVALNKARVLFSQVIIGFISK